MPRNTGRGPQLPASVVEESNEGLDQRPAEEILEVPKEVPGELLGMTLASAHHGEKRKAEPVEVQRFRVVKGGKIIKDGAVSFLKEGKIIDGRSHDLDRLRTQNIILEPFDTIFA